MNTRMDTNIKTNKYETAFTLVELLVAVSLFLVAITITVGVFVRSLKTQRVANSIMSVNSSASLAIEQMAREIRQGVFFTVSGNSSLCSGEQFDQLEFQRYKGGGFIPIVYRLNRASGRIERTEGNGAPSALTSPDVKVQRLCFALSGGGGRKTSPPWRITVFMRLLPRDPGLSEKTLDLQTTISARILPGDLL